jgi:hypothetical protein
VTDQGFLKESSVVWETLSSIDGDGHFVDNNFVTAPPKESPITPIKSTANIPTDAKILSPAQQIEQE